MPGLSREGSEEHSGHNPDSQMGAWITRTAGKQRGWKPAMLAALLETMVLDFAALGRSSQTSMFQAPHPDSTLSLGHLDACCGHKATPSQHLSTYVLLHAS